jgi:predicted amidohydrolase
MQEEQQLEFEELVAALEREGDGAVPALAVLWTWLEPRLQDLGSRRVKGPEIVENAERKPAYTGLNEELRDSLRSDPVVGAAEMMARVAHGIAATGQPLMREARGFDGEAVLVSWGESELVRKASGIDFIPSTREHPSLTTLAPCLDVSPVDERGLLLKGRQARGLSWEAALNSLQEELATENPKLSVHLDTLGQHGLSGWSKPEGGLGGYFGEPDDADRKACEEAARAAVRRASEHDGAGLLVLPELAATDSVLAAIRAELRTARHPPALTVVGLRHVEAEDPSQDCSNHLNEAVVLAPDGKELWRHRKLTEAGAVDGIGEYEPFIEDILLGETLAVFQTPIGNFAVVICLDSFAERARERLARSPANILLIPSLSESVMPHRVSLQQLVVRLAAIAFVCNRSPVKSEGDGLWNGKKARSFWVMVLSSPVIPPAKRGSELSSPSFVYTLKSVKNGRPTVP